MNRRLSITLFLALLLLLLSLATLPALGSGAAVGPSQTWPSRTPTPSGGQPPGPEPPPGQTPEATPEPGSTPLATLQVGVPVPVPGAEQSSNPPATGGATGVQTEVQIVPGAPQFQLPSADEVGNCGLPPIAVALGPVNVRSGPGIEFDTIAEMIYQEERVIVGRAADAAWWQILLTPQRQGWVSDQAVAVIGYTGATPITFGELTEESQPLWNPTPDPDCEPPSEEELAINSGRLESVILVERPPISSGRPPTPEPDAGLGGGDSVPGFSLLRPDDSATGLSMIWLPIVGAFLIIAGGIALLVQRRQQ